MSIDLDTIAKAEKELKQLEDHYKELAADAALTAASFAPPPFGTVADVVSIGKSLWSGDWGGALLDVVGLIPIVGDTIKGATKGTKIAAKMDEVADAIKAARAKLARKKDNLVNGSQQNQAKIENKTNGSSTGKCPVNQLPKTTKVRDMMDEYPNANTRRKKEISEELGNEGGKHYLQNLVNETDIPVQIINHKKPLPKDFKMELGKIYEFSSGRSKPNMVYLSKDGRMIVLENKGGYENIKNPNIFLKKLNKGKGEQQGTLKYLEKIAKQMKQSKTLDGRKEIGDKILTAIEKDNIDYTVVKTSPSTGKVESFNLLIK